MEPGNSTVLKIDVSSRGITDQALLKAAKKLGIKKFDGVFMKEQAIMYPIMQNKGILNIGDDIGTHWIGYYIEKRVGEVVVNFFDSFGLPVPDLFRERFEGEIGTYIVENITKIQHDDSLLCGMYCLYFINELDKGRGLGSIVLDFSNKKDKLWDNDKILIKYFNNFKIKINFM